tara:strand:+ start:5785 stop:6612 length:828 start_codon:yes stop_codon:yes gene_type:complete
MKLKKYTLFRPRVRTKNHTAEILRPKYKKLPLFPYRVLIRLGSVTRLDESKFKVIVNPLQAILNSSHKLKMKNLFEEKGVCQSMWYTIKNNILLLEGIPVNLEEISFPLIAKKIFGKKGEGMKKINNLEELNLFLSGNTSEYFIEKFYNYSKEYRIHTSIASDCFYACRKVRLKDSEEKWFFNSTNCNWLLESNENFDRPSNWEKLVQHSKLALEAVGLDVGAVDIRIQSNTTKKGELREDPKFIVCEINSAPSFGETTKEKYLKEIPKIIKEKE